MLKRINVLAVFCVGLCSQVNAQDVNSPYSRYALGDLVPQQNILSRAMGGLNTAYYDILTVNYSNPASYGRLQTVTFDFGVEVDNLTIRSLDPVRKFSNASPNMAYINLGIPLIKTKSKDPAKDKQPKLGMVVGLRPTSRISYKIQRNEKLTTGTLNDSIATLFEGTGGSQQVYTGLGYRFKNLSIGINVGYLFGSKDYSSRRVFLNDTVAYYKSNHQTKTNYNGFFFNAGAQYTINLGKKMMLRLGAQGNWEQQLKGSRDLIRQTFDYDANDGTFQIDSVYRINGEEGDIILPQSVSGGFIIDKPGRWLVGVDYSTTKWSDYRYFGEEDYTQDSWEIRVGGQMVPLSGKNYWSNVAYRTGFSFGKDYINVGAELPKWTISLGAGLPMRKPNYSNQATIIHTSIEFGKRGNDKNSVQESFFRFAVALSMSDIWFIKRKYD